MEVLVEQVLIYSFAGILCVFAIIYYLVKQKKKSLIVEEKIRQAKLEGLYEPVSLHPVIDENSCIRTGACISACPEKDILGIRNGKATTINASRCVGHGACFHACPTHAITLVIGTEKRGVDLPHVKENFETNVPGIFIAGELGGMGLIKNAVSQGRQAVENIVKMLPSRHNAEFDLIIVGAGPAGISASLTARKNNLKFLILEQDTLGGTVFTFPRQKIVMTSSMDLPLYGKVKLSETSKSELLDLWTDALSRNNIEVRENTRVENVSNTGDFFQIETAQNIVFTSKTILLAIGRRGSPRKLGVPGENLEKVAYRLLDPEIIRDKEIIVVGGGDSAIESALLLAADNHVILSYRGENFSRIKAGNKDAIEKAIQSSSVDVRFGTVIIEIKGNSVLLRNDASDELLELSNDLVYIFAGGELPSQFLQKAGIQINTKFGEAILKHK